MHVWEAGERREGAGRSLLLSADVQEGAGVGLSPWQGDK